MGPISFTVFLNDLGTKSRSRLMKCADDPKLEGSVSPEANWNTGGPDDPEGWRDRTGMKFSSPEFTVRHLGLSKKGRGNQVAL